MRRPRLGMVFAFVAVVAHAGCDSASTPTSPTASVPLPVDIFEIAGVVAVRTSTGLEPVAGAEVREASLSLRATTDTDGRYRLPRVAPGLRLLQVSRWGYETESTQVTVTADTELDIVVVPIPTYTLSGTVFEMTPDGRVPVESVWVYCDSCGSPDGHTEVHSDTTGAYSFAWSADGPHRLLVRKAGFGLANPSGNLPGYAEIITATVRGDTRFDIELVRDEHATPRLKR